MRIGVAVATVGMAVAVAVPVAFASHGKAGLWEITTHMSMPGMSANIPPEALARMKAMGMAMPGGDQSFSSQICMTAAQVAQDQPPPTRSTKNCTVSNLKHDGHTITADMTCSGEMQGTGHYEATYDSDEHYSGSYSFTGTAHGHPGNMSSNFEGRWISADCGSVK